MESLKIGEVIKKLRKDKGMTQEDLAQYVGVSTPAISKWESGTTYPDITILPILANLFEVSIDNLLNYKAELEDSEIIKIVKECEAYIINSDIDGYLDIHKKYIRKYPSNYKLHYGLVGLHVMAYANITDENVRENLVEDSIKILENSVKNTKDMKIKEASLTLISSQYLLKNQADKAEEAIKKIYKPTCNPNMVLPIIYTEQGKVEQARKLMQENLQTALIEAMGAAIALGTNYYNYKDGKELDYIDFDKAQKYFELSIEIKKIFEDEQMTYLSFMSLAHIYLRQGDIEKAINTLKEMMVIVRKYNLNKFKSPNTKWCFDKLDKVENNTNAYDAYEFLIMSLLKDFDEIKDNKDFINIIKEIKELKSKNS